METKSRFVLIQHKAKKAGLHYDLRFKIPDSKDWGSYMVKKGIPKGSEKVLAVRTTVHSEKEALFTGEIPVGQYGAGTLTKDDSGICDILQYEPNKKITIRFHGNKLNGIYYFINLAHIKKGEKNQYWFFKGKLP